MTEVTRLLIKNRQIDYLEIEYGSVADFIGNLISLENELKEKGWQNIWIGMEYGREGGEYVLIGDRLESEKQAAYRQRLEIARAQKQARGIAKKRKVEKNDD